MDRETLLALDKPALVELLLELVASYEARLAEQQQRIIELEARLAKLEGPPKTPGNSSVPPSAGQKPNRAERRQAQRGTRRGDPGTSRFRKPAGTCRSPVARNAVGAARRSYRPKVSGWWRGGTVVELLRWFSTRAGKEPAIPGRSARTVAPGL